MTRKILSFLNHCDQESAKHLEQPKVGDPPPPSLLLQTLSIPQLQEDKGRTPPLLPLTSTSFWTTYPLMSYLPIALGLRTSFKDSQGEEQDDMEPTASPAPPVLHPVPSQLILHIGVRDVEVGMLNLVTGACLIYGARTGNGGLMLPWMIQTLIELVLVLVAFFSLICGTESIISDYTGGDIVRCILVSALTAFLLLVVSSYREEVKKNRVEQFKKGEEEEKEKV